jgi:hypothetical protein
VIIDSSLGSLMIQTCRKLPTMAPNTIDINVSIPCDSVGYYNYGSKCQPYGMLE